MNEKLQQYALIAEIVGGIAVVVTLIFLAFEMRANTQAMRAATYDSLVADIANWRLIYTTDEELQEIDFLRITEGRDALSPLQARYDANVVIALFQHYERAFIQWRAGNLDDSAWDRFERAICGPSGNPGFEQDVGSTLDTFTTVEFTEFRKNQCSQLD